MINMKDPKDILRQVQADAKGISPKDVKITDFIKNKRKSKKSKKSVESESKSDSISNGEGFGLTEMSVEFCGYGEIGKKRKRIEKKCIEEWGAFDFFYYAEKEFINKYGKSMNLNVGGNSLEINRIRDKFYDLFGFCCNLIMKDYIDFFFKNYLKSIINTDGAFYFRQMRNDKIICDFCEGYDFSRSFLKYSESKKVIEDNILSNKSINESYMISDTSLVSNYGIVISLNWLMKVKKKSPSEASRMVIAACRELASKDMINIVKISTERFSPYPKSIPFKQPQLVMDRIDSLVRLDVEFNDNSKYDFLK